MALRKLWSTTFGGYEADGRCRHQSQAEAYRQVANDRANWAAGASRRSIVNVWVDERTGHGWQLFERIDFTEEGRP